MMPTVSTIFPTSSRQPAAQNPLPAAGTPAVASDDSRFQNVFGPLSDDKDRHKPECGGEMPAEQSGSSQTADSNAESDAELIDVAMPMPSMPLMIIFPSMTPPVAPIAPVADMSPESVSAMTDDGTIAGATLKSTSFVDVLPQTEPQ